MAEIRPSLLIIRDGWGANHNPAHDAFNAIKLAHTPVADNLTQRWPRTEIMACGLDVGLPTGIMGNSEVGHQNIGAGRVVDQEIVRINKAIDAGEINKNPALQTVFNVVKANKSKLHFMGLVSDAGVHSMLSHLYGLLEAAKKEGIAQVFIHAITDGRDTSPFSGKGYIEQLEERCKAIGIGQLASVSGRFWAMDRDKRWERVEKAYSCMLGLSTHLQATKAIDIIEGAYANPPTNTQTGDEFVLPSWIAGADGKPIGPIEDGDGVVFFNFRGDRPREIIAALTDPKFIGFERKAVREITLATMTDYEKGLCPNVIFPKPPKMKQILGDYLSQQGIRQFRCAETEKNPHVTFFFNDYREEPFPLEDRGLVPSPRDVQTYDQKPEMSAYGVCAAVKKAILTKQYGLIVVNFANTDMVGHTGSLPAVIKAAEAVDVCVGELLEAMDYVGGTALITADHGNADQMWNPETNTPHTQHTLNPVELVIYGQGLESLKLKLGGRLADIAPTLLRLMGLVKPIEMTGESLIE